MGRDQDLTFEERLLSEAYREFLLEMRQAGRDAADGAVLDDLEGLIVGKGRDLLRRTFETQVQAAVEEAEKKGFTPAPRAERNGKTVEHVDARS